MTRTATDSLPTPVQDPELGSFLLRLRKKNTDTASHKQTVDSYYQYWDSDRKDILDNESSVAERRSSAKELTNHFYDLVTDFYEYGMSDCGNACIRSFCYVLNCYHHSGWGTSFHFARMFKESTFKQAIAQHEHYLALKLGLKPGMECLDVGCGVGEHSNELYMPTYAMLNGILPGGPLREIAKFSGAYVTGLNNNAYQVERCRHLAKENGLASICKAVKVFIHVDA